MFKIGLIENLNLINMLFIIFGVLSFYFTLTFLEYLRKSDERVIKQAKMGAILCFALACIILTFK